MTGTSAPTLSATNGDASSPSLSYSGPSPASTSASTFKAANTSPSSSPIIKRRTSSYSSAHGNGVVNGNGIINFVASAGSGLGSGSGSHSNLPSPASTSPPQSFKSLSPRISSLPPAPPLVNATAAESSSTGMSRSPPPPVAPSQAYRHTSPVHATGPLRSDTPPPQHLPAAASSPPPPPVSFTTSSFSRNRSLATLDQKAVASGLVRTPPVVQSTSSSSTYGTPPSVVAVAEDGEETVDDSYFPMLASNERSSASAMRDRQRSLGIGPAVAITNNGPGNGLEGIVDGRAGYSLGVLRRASEGGSAPSTPPAKQAARSVSARSAGLGAGGAGSLASSSAGGRRSTTIQEDGNMHSTEDSSSSTSRLSSLPPLHPPGSTGPGGSSARSRRISIVDGVLVTATSPSPDRAEFARRGSSSSRVDSRPPTIRLEPFGGSVGLGLVNSQSEILDMRSLGLGLDDGTPLGASSSPRMTNGGGFGTSISRSASEQGLGSRSNYRGYAGSTPNLLSGTLVPLPGSPSRTLRSPKGRLADLSASTSASAPPVGEEQQRRTTESPSAPTGTATNGVAVLQSRGSSSALENGMPPIPVRPSPPIPARNPLRSRTSSNRSATMGHESAMRTEVNGADDRSSARDQSTPLLPPARLPAVPSIDLSTPTKAMGPTPPPRSPSMPLMPPPTSRRYSGNTESTATPSPNPITTDLRPGLVHSHSRSRSNPATPIMPTAMSSQVSLPRSPRLSKRAHLIQEICQTERSYAQDLCLVRDAFLYRIRPSSQHSTVSTQLSPGGLSAASRTSVFTFETAETSSTSLQDANHRASDASLSEISQKVVMGGDIRMPSRRTSSNNVNLQRASMSRSSPLTPQDIKTIFINLEQLAAFSAELADTFESVAGDTTSGREADIPEEGPHPDPETDKLGETFLAAVPQMTALYTTYCARQSSANARLLELMSNRTIAAYINDCWKSVQPHTNAWDLGSMLIKPVQRVMKYPMLFADLLANTTPAHPDYFSLRQAAEAARSVADEVNEVKRRKDVVERVISTSSRRTLPLATPGKESKLLKFGKRFKKDKERDTTVPGVAAQIVIGAADAEALDGLINRLEQADQVVRRVGKEVNSFPERVREVWSSQRSITDTWQYVVRLDDTDLADQRIEMFKAVSEEITNGPLRVLHEEVRNSIMPVFSTLLRLAVNPKALIGRMQSRQQDYMRVQAARAKNELKTVDKAVVSGAEDYVALHAQLLEELPAYLEGYQRILDAALASFSGAQARFHESVKSRLQVFISTWSMDGGFAGDIGTPDSPSVDLQSMSGKSIVKNWFEEWRPINEAMETLRITQARKHRPLSNASSAISLSRNGSARHQSRSSIATVPEGPTIPVHRSRSSSLMGAMQGEFGTASRPPSTIFDRSSDAGDSGTEVQVPRARPRSFLPPVTPAGSITLPGLGSPVPPSPRPEDGLPPGYVRTMWAAAPTMYRCKCVAAFQLDFKLFYAGLLFLNMAEDDVLDILHEVGRVDQLADLPLDVGVEDDGLLVGRNASGQVGLILCSFLEPLK